MQEAKSRVLSSRSFLCFSVTVMVLCSRGARLERSTMSSGITLVFTLVSASTPSPEVNLDSVSSWRPWSLHDAAACIGT